MILSIIIPSYNHEQFVLSTIQAAARIDIQDKEILVIDDGSTDASVSVIREYIANKGESASIRLIARENRGLVKTLNEGLSIARGKYIYGVASDDIPIPEGVVRLVDILENNSDLQFVIGNALLMFSEQQCEFKPTYGELHKRFFALPYDRRQKQMYLHYPQPLLLQTTVFKTSALKAIGGWREDIVVDDFSLFLRLLSTLKNAGKDFGYEPEIMVCFYRQHQTNSHRNLERQFRMVEQALTKLCPPEWRDAALFRNFVTHGAVALEKGKPMLAARFFRSTVSRVGVVRSVYTVASELRYTLAVRLSGNHVKDTGSIVVHPPAASQKDFL